MANQAAAARQSRAAKPVSMVSQINALRLKKLDRGPRIFIDQRLTSLPISKPTPKALSTQVKGCCLMCEPICSAWPSA